MWLVYPLIFLAGFVDSIAGGGRLISLTAYRAVGLPAHLALGTNKFSSTAGTLVAAGRYAHSRSVLWGPALLAAAGALVGAAIGAHMALMLDEKIISYCMLVLVPLAGVFTVVKKDMGAAKERLPRRALLAASAGIGVAMGAYDGFFGPGTGAFLTILFTTALGLDMVTACGNAKIVNLASNAAALVTFVLGGSVDYAVAVPCAVCGILGNYIGAGMAVKRGARIVRPVLLVVIALLLSKVVVDLFFAGA
ncbi:MAG: TSUP family transporter [Eubacteriales bacterium]|nr:TSUP family transporter [Eubacteriales bacterium]